MEEKFKLCFMSQKKNINTFLTQHLLFLFQIKIPPAFCRQNAIIYQHKAFILEYLQDRVENAHIFFQLEIVVITLGYR